MREHQEFVTRAAGPGYACEAEAEVSMGHHSGQRQKGWEWKTVCGQETAKTHLAGEAQIF